MLITFLRNGLYYIFKIIIKITIALIQCVGTSLSLINQVILAAGFEGGDEQFAFNFSPREYCGLSRCSSGLPSIVPEMQTKTHNSYTL